MTTYSWMICTLITAPSVGGLTDVVLRAETYYLASDEGTTVQMPKTVEMGPMDIESFTPFAALTEAQIIGWVETQLGSEQIAIAQSALNSLLTEARNVVKVPPWLISQ